MFATYLPGPHDGSVLWGLAAMAVLLPSTGRLVAGLLAAKPGPNFGEGRAAGADAGQPRPGAAVGAEEGTRDVGQRTAGTAQGAGANAAPDGEASQLLTLASGERPPARAFGPEAERQAGREHAPGSTVIGGRPGPKGALSGEERGLVAGARAPGMTAGADERAPEATEDRSVHAADIALRDGELAPETALMAGWGGYCLFMTAWAVTTTAPLTFAFAGFALAGLAGLFRRTPGAIPWRAILLSVPLFLVLLPALPSQVDTWLNLLPNLAYLADHASLPADGGPPSWSFLPAAPYNTQFVGFGVSVLAGHLAANALSLFNAVLLCAAGLHLARVCGRPAAGGPRSPRLSLGLSPGLPTGDGGQTALLPGAGPLAPNRHPALPDHRDLHGQPGWWACAAGFLLAVPLNPGFTPRVFFASYGEAPLAVTLMFAVALGADLFAAARADAPCRRRLAALALVLAALVEIKQSALGLLLPFAAGLLLLGLAAPVMRRRRWAAMVAVSCAPALLLYLAWRWYVLGHFAVGELKMLPLAEWHLDLLPQIFAGIAFAVFQKATYFALVAALLVAGVVETRRRPWGHTAVVLALGAALVAGFNLFLLFTYVAHFPAVWAVNAHSYFRYMSQLSLVVVLGLVSWLQPAIAAWLARRTPRQRRLAARGAVALAAVLPLAAAPLLRFDLDAPQPLLWTMASNTAALLHDGDRLALVVPGDGDDAAGSLLRGVLLFTPPRRQHLDFRSELAANQAALDDAHAHGFDHALVTCAPAALGGLGAGQAGLLAYGEDKWRPVAVWALPAGLRRKRFSAMLPHSVFCK